MRTRPWSTIRDQLKADPVRWEQIETEKRAMQVVHQLAALREQQGVTQAKLANSLNVSQARVSKIEHQEDIYLSTLRDYIAALGGELHVAAIFPDGIVELAATPQCEATAVRG